MSKFKRKKKLIDITVQGSFVLQYLKHWVMILITTLVMAFVWLALVSGPLRSAGEYVNDIWLHYAPLLVALVLLAPVIIYDSIKLSHRFVGPMYRVRQELKRLVRGEEVAPIRFRDGDFWMDFADDFNVLIARLKHAEAGQGPVEELEVDHASDATLSSTAS